MRLQRMLRLKRSRRWIGETSKLRQSRTAHEERGHGHAGPLAVVDAHREPLRSQSLALVVSRRSAMMTVCSLVPKPAPARVSS